MELEYEYVDFFTHVQVVDDHDNMEDHYVARIHIQPVEVLHGRHESGFARGMLIRVVEERAGRRRRRRQATPRWMWKSVADIMRVVGTMKVEDGKYIINTPFCT